MRCPNCGSNQYNIEFFVEGEHGAAHWHCYCCDYKHTTANTKRSCPRCHAVYYEIAWFNPSGCKKCHLSFVD